MAIKTDTFASSAGAAGTDNLDDVTSRGATTTNAITVGGVTVGTEYSLPTLDGSANQILQTNGTGTVSFATLDFTGGLEYKGAFNATAGTPSLTNAEKGDFYIIDTAGTIYGQTWAVGDHLLINEDMGGTITDSKIDKIDNTQAVTSVNTQTGAVVVSGNDILADHTAVNYTAANNNIDGHLSGIDSALGAVASPTLDDVTTNGDTTTNAINVGTITTSGDILADTADSRTIGDEDTRFITYYGDMNGAIRFKAKNDQGGQITKGQAVYIKGLAGDGTTPTVGLADADDPTKMPAFGLAFNTANDSAEIQIVQVGNLGGLDTSGFSVGDTLYIDTTAGAVTKTKPTGESSQLQNIGRVIRSDNGDGVIMVGGAGRSAATPNLDQDKIFLGNASNQSVSTALNTIGLSKFNNDSGFLTDITSESLNDLSDVSFTAGAGIDNYVLTYDNSTSSWGAEVVPSAPVTSVNTQTGAVVVSGNDILADHTAVNYTASNNNVDGHFSGVDTKLGTLLADITGESLNDLSDVSFTAGAGIDNYVLTYDNSTTSWGAEAAPTASPASETTAGVIEIATNAEATAGTATDKALVPSNISSLDLSAMDNTTSAFISDITSESLNDLSDVSFTAGAGIDNYVLTYDNTTSSWGAEAAAGGTAASETTAGIIEIATNAEATAGTATDKALVPSNLSSVDLSVLDNTTSAFISDITSESLNDLSDVSFTAGAGIDNYVLTYDHSTTSWGAEAAAGGGEYTVSNQGSTDFSASNNYFYYVNTASGTTTTVTLPARTYAATDERIKFFNHGNGTLRVQETSGTSRIHPDESGSDPGGSGQSYKDISSRSVIEFIGIPNTYQWEWAISAQLELGKDTLANDGDVLRYDSSSDQMTALPYTFPTADGSANQILKTDGAGALTFIDQPGGTQPTLTSASPSANYTILTHDGIEEIYVLTPSANISVFLPAASSCGSGYKYHIKNMASGFTLTIDANSSETIDGSTTVDIANQYEALTLITDGSNWFIIQ